MTSDDLDLIIALVREHSGVVLRPDKAFFIESRLAPVARREKLPNVEALCAQLRQRPTAALVQQVLEAVQQQDTAFFRDRAVFKTLQTEAFPALAARRGEKRLSVLSLGCGTGQEAYSLALLGQALSPHESDIALDVVGADLSDRALQKAKAGVYTHFEVQRGMPIRQLLRHFEKVEDNWRASAQLRQAVTWRRVNLLRDLGELPVFDVILCRNVISSFAPEAQMKVMELIERHLALDGVLVVGAKEVVSPPASFTRASDAEGVYVRNPAFARAAA